MQRTPLNQEQLEKIESDLKASANRLFSTDDGKRLARQMIAQSNLYSPSESLTDAHLRYLAGMQDFVRRFIINLVDKDVLLKIMES